MMAQSPGLKEADMATICDTWTPRKTYAMRFRCAHLPLSFHSFDPLSRDPFTILAGGSVLIIVFRGSHFIRWLFTCPRLRTLYLSRPSRSGERAMGDS